MLGKPISEIARKVVEHIRLPLLGPEELKDVDEECQRDRLIAVSNSACHSSSKDTCLYEYSRVHWSCDRACGRILSYCEIKQFVLHSFSKTKWLSWAALTLYCALIVQLLILVLCIVLFRLTTSHMRGSVTL